MSSQPFSRRSRVNSSIGKVVEMPAAGASTVLRATSMVISRPGSAATASSRARPTSGSTWTGTRPALVQLLRKMSANPGETTAAKP